MSDGSTLNPANDWQGFYTELQNETPRAGVILAASFLDVQLRQLIANFLIDEKNIVEDFLGGEGKSDRPLSTFSSRTKAAYCLGLISKDEYDDLNMIRRIRNKFAHRLHDLSFDDQDIIDWCNSLQLPKRNILPKWHFSHRDRFLFGITLLASQIALRALSIGQNRRSVPKPFAVGQVISLSDEELDKD